MIGDVILRDDDNDPGVRNRWTQVPPSEVAVRANRDHAGPDDVCLLCGAPATHRSILQYQVVKVMEERGDETISPKFVFRSGEEDEEFDKHTRIAAMATCQKHTGQWVLERVEHTFLWPKASLN